VNILSGLWSLIKKWPVRAQAIVQAFVAWLTAFGLSWTVEQVAATLALSAVVLAFFTETAVTPTASPTIQEGTLVTVTTPEGQPDRVVTA
jgi:hypothetical protein